MAHHFIIISDGFRFFQSLEPHHVFGMKPPGQLLKCFGCHVLCLCALSGEREEERDEGRGRGREGRGRREGEEEEEEEEGEEEGESIRMMDH